MKSILTARVMALGLFVSNMSFALSYTNNLIAHFDGTQLQVEPGGKVSRWLNQVQGSGDAWTVTGEAQPTARQLQNAGGDTYTVLEFDGVGNHLTMSSDTNNYDGNTFTWIIAYKSGDTNQNGKAMLSSAYDHVNGGETAYNSGVWQTFVNSGNHLYVSGRNAIGDFKSVATFAPNNDWHVISGKWDGSSRLYAWLDGSYLGKSSGVDANPTGHRRTRIGSNAGATAGGFFKGMIAEVLIYKENVADTDRVAIENELMAKYSTLSDQSPYDRWAQAYNLSGDDSALTNNPDGDLANNLAEYALGGNPTNSGDMGHLPYSEIVQDGGNNWFQFIYYVRNDASIRGLSYFPQVSPDLATGGWTTNGVSTVGVGTFNSEFDSVTSRVSTVSEEEQFMQLLMQFQE